MHIEKSYIAISTFFDKWVRIIEIQTRKLEAQDSKINDSKILIISPPTDHGIKILTKANPKGESYLLCFSPAIEQIARKYSNQHNIENLKISVAPFFGIPFDDSYFDVIFTNCLFDFCQEYDFEKIIVEIRRALKNNGSLFSVYMNVPSGLISQLWVSLLKNFPFLSKGCHPVDVKPFLFRQTFKLKKEISLNRFGFPIKYIHVEKTN